MKFTIGIFLVLLTPTLNAKNIYSFDDYYKSQTDHVFRKIDNTDRKTLYESNGKITDKITTKSQKTKITYNGENLYLNNKPVKIKNLTNKKLPKLDASLLQLYTPVSNKMPPNFFCIDTWALHANSTAQREKYIIFFTDKRNPSGYLIPGYLSSCIAIRYSSSKKITFPVIQIKNEKSNEQSITIQYKILSHGKTLDTEEKHTGKFIDADDVHHFYLDNAE
ncbi:hypothetical protein [Azospira sp.]|uniref:hypothetical protein n=1 Tax=Azospira sp. TaxID=1872671 RepID=UPI00256D8BF5|nr:hypothetical protein [Azospira sp.]MDK9690021.1 hypothetical protein [Azospira sp.]